MTASSSDPGLEPERYLADGFDQLTAAATPEASVHIAFQIATELRARGIPTIFATGYDASMIPAELADTVRLEKPVDMKALCRAVATSCL